MQAYYSAPLNDDCQLGIVAFVYDIFSAGEHPQYIIRKPDLCFQSSYIVILFSLALVQAKSYAKSHAGKLNLNFPPKMLTH